MTDLRELIKAWRAKAENYRALYLLADASQCDACADELERALSALTAALEGESND